MSGGSPACTPPRGTPASSGGPRWRPRTPTGPPSSRAEPGYESCEPGYATFIEALGQVYCGNLDRYVELTREVAALPGRGQAYGIAAYVDGLQSPDGSRRRCSSRSRR